MIGIDLFAGAGGMSLGAELAGVSVEFAVESDSHSARTYSNNHPSSRVHVGDVRTVNKRTLRSWLASPKELIIFGGPPCQGFSWSNGRTRNTDNGSNWLFTEFVRIIKILMPAWVVFENVQGIIDTADGLFVKQIGDKLSGLGYAIHSSRLNAVHFGVPQDRTRFFLVGTISGKKFSFPKEQKSRYTVGDAIRDLPLLENGNSNCWLKYGRARPSRYGELMRNGLLGCSNHLVTQNATYVVNRYSYVPQGGNWADIPARLMKNYTDRSRCHTGIYHRLKLNAPSVVIGNFRKNMETSDAKQRLVGSRSSEDPILSGFIRIQRFYWLPATTSRERSSTAPRPGCIWRNCQHPLQPEGHLNERSHSRRRASKPREKRCRRSRFYEQVFDYSRILVVGILSLDPSRVPILYRPR